MAAKSPEHVAIIGSRGFPDREIISAFVRALPEGTVVVSGGARGVDRWAEEAATDSGLETLIFHADWKRLGKAAGPVDMGGGVTQRKGAAMEIQQAGHRP